MTRALRRQLAASGVGASSHFRWRGAEVSRLEGFTDAVFAFAVTLLVVSLEVPRTYGELMNVRNLLAAAVGVVSIAIALTVPQRMIGLAGYAYLLFGPVFALHGSMTGRRRRQVAARGL